MKVLGIALLVAGVGAGALVAYKYGLPKLKAVGLKGLFKMTKGSI